MKNNRYDLEDFHVMRDAMASRLYDGEEPVCCAWHAQPEKFDHLVVAWEDGDEETHVAQACNVASIIAGIERLLALPRSHVACASLSEILLLQFDILREYVRDSVQDSAFVEEKNETIIRLWAGFLKHPRQFISTHRCDWLIDEEVAAVVDTSFLLQWDDELKGARNKNAKRDAMKQGYSNTVAEVHLPEVRDLTQFITTTGERILKLLRTSA